MDSMKSKVPVLENENVNSVVYSLFCSECKKYNSYLGFYPDRKVIQINSTGSSQQIIRWFNWDCDNASKGHYDIECGGISFYVTSSHGRDQYVGSIEHETLDLWINAFYDCVIYEYIGTHKIFKYVGELKADGSFVKDYKIDNLKGLWHW